jgi:SAM-dependent methyltransferase
MTGTDVFHLGLMAELNDAYNEDEAPEIDMYLELLEAGGGPALDAGCGPGRLIRRARAAGLEVEGSDISADMLEICRRRCRQAGFEPVLHHGATGELQLPGRYRTVVMCGAFGLNGRRDDDVRALEAVHRLLTPRGSVWFDIEPGWAHPKWWHYFADPSGLPTEWRAGGSTPTRGGSAIETDVRDLSVDRSDMSAVHDVRCRLVEGGRPVREEVHRLVMRFYNPHEVLGMLREAGFVDVSFTERPLWGGKPSHLFTARRPDG